MDGITGMELARGRRLYAERAWSACCDALGEADAIAPLEAPDLVLLSISSYLCGRDADSVRYLSRAYDGYIATHEWAMAARAAFWMCFTLFNLGDVVRASAWAARSKALVDEHEITGPLPAYQESLRAHQLMERGSPDEALAISLANITIGRVEDEPDLETLSRVKAGQALVALGRPAEALEQLDQVILAVEGDRLSPRSQEWPTAPSSPPACTCSTCAGPGTGPRLSARGATPSPVTCRTAGSARYTGRTS
jgi:hypothetical protein